MNVSFKFIVTLCLYECIICSGRIIDATYVAVVVVVVVVVVVAMAAASQITHIVLVNFIGLCYQLSYLFLSRFEAARFYDCVPNCCNVIFAAAVDVVVIIFDISQLLFIFFSSFLSISIPFVGGRCC